MLSTDVGMVQPTRSVLNCADMACLVVQIERVLLSSQVQSGGPPSREQELLHYQWFADMGYVDAQRTVGRLLAQGSPQQAQNAMHYFKYAAFFAPCLCGMIAMVWC